MNYLAHAYLSFGHPGILVGNMISDFVKGKKQFDYPDMIRHGIQLHRQIDSFTDQHPVTREAKTFFRQAVGLYAGAFVDVVYDHFLALDTTELDAAGWQLFSATTYNQLNEHAALLPEPFGRMLPYMRQQDWLYNYRFRQGISNSFAGLARRASYLNGSEPAFAAFEENYSALGQLYRAFFPDVKKMARAGLDDRLIR
jgi:acyl carrier protein phosphodiesterase